MARTTAQVDGATLVLPGHDASPITVDTAAWFAWLEHATTFVFTGPSGRFTARKEQRACGGGYWKAYRTSHGTLHRVYLGKAQDLTPAQPRCNNAGGCRHTSRSTFCGAHRTRIHLTPQPARHQTVCPARPRQFGGSPAPVRPPPGRPTG
jgi:hypothetical protein